MITLTTDFGLTDGFAGVMKGVILTLNPEAQIVDLCHGVEPQDVIGGALVLEAGAPYFPAGTVHVGVVDPGVGTARRGIVIRTSRAFYVGPDNGLFELAIRRDAIEEVVTLNKSGYFIQSLPQPVHELTVSATFQGRDVFAPVAAHLSLGVAIEQLGERSTPGDLVRLNFPEVADEGGDLRLQIVSIDRFGNLITNLARARYAEWNGSRAGVEILCAGIRFQGLAATYGDVPEGSPAAYIGSSGRLEIALRGGHAARHFQVQRGATVRLGKARA